MRAVLGKALALIGLGIVIFASWRCGLWPNQHEFYPLDCEPAEIDFGEVLVGEVSEEGIVVTNPSRLKITSYSLFGGDRFSWHDIRSTVRLAGFTSSDCAVDEMPFDVQGPFPVDLSEHDRTEVTAQFSPTSAGDWECWLRADYEVLAMVTDAIVHDEEIFACSVRLQGSSRPGPQPACALQPPDAQFDYGQVPVGSWSDLTLTVRNETPDLLTTNQFTYVLEDPTADCRVFTIDPADTAGVIGPGESKDIVVRFAPDGEDSFECTRSLASLKEPPTDPPEPIANACPTTMTWRGTGVIGAPVWSNCAPGGNSDYHGVFGLMGSEVYVAGDGGSVLVSGGDCQWAPSATGFSEVNLTDTWAYSDGASKAIWAVGNVATTPPTGAILRSDGAQWEKVDEGWLVTYGAVWGSGLDDVYFAGTGVSTDFPNAKHWDGSLPLDTLHMSEMGMSPVTGVSGTASNDIWAVLGQSWNPVYRFQGVQWASQSQAFMTKPLHDVWAVQGTGFYAVYAVGEDGAIYHYDGNQWTDESIAGETRDFYGVWVSTTGKVFVVGEGHVIYHYDGNAWTQQHVANLEGDLMDVWGFSDVDVYAVGTNGLILRYAPPGV